MFCSIVMQLLILFRKFLDKFIDYIFSLYWSNKEQPLSPLEDDYFVMESAVSIAKKIRERKLTSEEVVTAYQRRINKVGFHNKIFF